MTTKTQKVTYNKIENLFSRLSSIVNTQEWYNNSVEKAFELEFLNYKGNFKNPKIKAKASCVYFTFNGLKHTYTAKDFLGVRNGVFMCYAFAEKYKDEILKEFNQDEIDFINSIWFNL